MKFFLHKFIKKDQTKKLRVQAGVVYSVITTILFILPVGFFTFNDISSYHLANQADACEEGSLCDNYCELTLSKSDTGYDPVMPGDNIVYNLHLVNSGTANCTGGGVLLKDEFDFRTLPIISDRESKINAKTASFWQWNFGTLVPGEIEDVNFTVKVDPNTPCDTILENKAMFWSDQTAWGPPVIENTKTIACAGPVCGDGHLDAGEECDDGNLTNGDGCSDLCFKEYASISGCKYIDDDGDGVLTGTEATLPGVSIRLLDPAGAQLAEQLTDDNGCYVFQNLDPGTYGVEELVSSPWQQTYPVSAYSNIIVNYLDDLTGYDFGNFQQTVDGADISLSKSVDKPSVVVGNTVVFTIQIKNEGSLDMSGVEVSDKLPAGLTYQSHTVSKGIYDSSTGLWTVGDLAVTETEILSITATVANVGLFTNVAEIIAHNETDIDSIPNNHILSEDDQSEVVVEATPPSVCTVNCGGGTPTYPKIEIDKTAAVAWTNPDSIVDYTVVIKNTGDAIGKDLILTDVLPAGLAYASSTLNGVWDLGYIDKNSSKTVKYQVLFPSGLDLGNYVNTATAQISNGNSASDDAVVEVRDTTVLGFAPVLEIDKRVDRVFTNPGGEAVYTVRVTNTNQGTLTAVNVTLVDRLPDKFTFTDDSTMVKTWVLGDLAPGESSTVSFTTKVNSGAINGIYKNIATAYADNASEVSDIEPIEVRQVVVEGYTLPDTNGSKNFFLSGLSGLLLILLGYLLKKYRQVQVIRL